MTSRPEITGHPANPRVLVVDDHPDLRLALCDTLAAEGYSVSQAADGEQALILLEEQLFDAAIVDVRMPVLDGFALLERMGEEHIRCPVVLTSVVADAPVRRRGQSLGMFAFHAKPFALGDLLSDLERAVAAARDTASGEP